MSGMRSPARRLREVAILLVGTIALHQLRFTLLPDAHGDQGHSYLPAAAAMAAGVLALAALQFGVSLLRAWRHGEDDPAGSAGLAQLWLRSGVALLVVHVAQEGTEALVSGRPLASLLAGLWLALALAAALGLLAALLRSSPLAPWSSQASALSRRSRGRRPGVLHPSS